jgi:peptidoglycan/xylan/chitin deacetylase (PgdA/CDA1 family)
MGLPTARTERASNCDNHAPHRLAVSSAFFFAALVAGPPDINTASTKTASPDASTPKRSTASRNESAVSEGATRPDDADAAKNTIEVVLTFDDGPHVEHWGCGKNHTERVVKTLKDNVVQGGIRAVFFVQTHAPGRGGTQIGRDIIATVAKQGHVIGIHTGSTRDHASHRVRARARPYDVNRNGVIDTADGVNGLESDMIRAKARIRKLVDSEPLYVRPTYGERNRTVEAVYRRQNLKMILWDVDSGDNTGSPGVDIVNQNIHKGIERCVAAGKKQLVILFHDINSRTAGNLEEYLGNICISAKKLGKTVLFTTSTERILQILNAKTYR